MPAENMAVSDVRMPKRELLVPEDQVATRKRIKS
jgi:hypothetical protein